MREREREREREARERGVTTGHQAGITLGRKEDSLNGTHFAQNRKKVQLKRLFHKK